MSTQSIAVTVDHILIIYKIISETEKKENTNEIYNNKNIL